MVYMAVQAEIVKDNADIPRIKEAMKHWWEDGATLSELHTAFNSNWDSLPSPDDEDDGGWEPFATQVQEARKELEAYGIYRK